MIISLSFFLITTLHFSFTVFDKEEDLEEDYTIYYYYLNRFTSSWYENNPGQSVTFYYGTDSLALNSSGVSSVRYHCATDKGFYNVTVTKKGGETSKCNCSESLASSEDNHATQGIWRCDSSYPYFFATQCEPGYVLFSESGLCFKSL